MTCRARRTRRWRSVNYQLNLPKPDKNYAISLCADKKNCESHHQTQITQNAQVRDGLATRTAPHLQPDLHRLRTHPRILHIAQGHGAIGEMSRSRNGMRRAHGFDLWWRTVDLSQD